MSAEISAKERYPAFTDLIRRSGSIRMREPLARTLGALSGDNDVVEYGYSDVVKLTGHACPTTAGAFLICKKALEKLYPGEIPVRGEISVRVHGEPDEGAFGVMAQVFTLITGAAGRTGFKGLGSEFRRKDLLRYVNDSARQNGRTVEFERKDNGSKVLARFRPENIPFPPSKGQRTGKLLQKIVWGAAKEDEKEEFRRLWSEKIEIILIEEKGIQDWLEIE